MLVDGRRWYHLAALNGHVDATKMLAGGAERGHPGEDCC